MARSSQEKETRQRGSLPVCQLSNSLHCSSLKLCALRRRQRRRSPRALHSTPHRSRRARSQTRHPRPGSAAPPRASCGATRPSRSRPIRCLNDTIDARWVKTSRPRSMTCGKPRRTGTWRNSRDTSTRTLRWSTRRTPRGTSATRAFVPHRRLSSRASLRDLSRARSVDAVSMARFAETHLTFRARCARPPLPPQVPTPAVGRAEQPRGGGDVPAGEGRGGWREGRRRTDLSLIHI